MCEHCEDKLPKCDKCEVRLSLYDPRHTQVFLWEIEKAHNQAWEQKFF